jgi:arylsulfatase
LPHVPLGAPLRWEGRSEQGAYGDVIMEIDDSVGRILAALDEHGLRERTLVIFTSDNGPWLNYGKHAGSAGPLREGKGTMWEGGARVPCIMRWPGRIPAGSACDELAATIDILPTIARLAGAPLPELPIDGVDITSLLEGREGARPRTSYCYYYGRRLIAMRRDQWKLVFPHEYRSYLGVEPGMDGHPGPYAKGKSGLELYDLEHDLGETTDVAEAHPDIVAELQALADRARKELGDRIENVHGEGVRPPGRLEPPRPSPIAHLARDKSVRLSAEPSPTYPGGGGPGLVDGILGSEDFHDGAWLGYEGVDLEAVVDLGTPTSLRRIACSFLQDQTSWIFLPRSVEFAVSADAAAWQVVASFEQETV